MFKGSFIKLVFGAIILLFSYVFPIFLIPIGSYSYSDDTGRVAYSFSLDGEVKQTIEIGDISNTLKQYYDIDDKTIYTSTNEEVPHTQLNKLAKVKNIYTIEVGGEELKNNWALGFTIIGFVLTGWGLIGLFVPKKKR